MESVEDVVIVGAGLAGLATALGLYRKGVKSLVLESSDSLRASGFALSIWTNAWRALDVLGVGDSLRSQHLRLQRLVASSTSEELISELVCTGQGKIGEHEVRCVRRDLLLQALEKDIPEGTIRYSSKVVSIEAAGNLKLLHLADGSVLKTKVLVGCDGVNSIVAKSLGLKKPSFSGRSAARGFTEFPDGHGFKPEFVQYFGEGFRVGLLPCNDNNIYWFFTWPTSAEGKEVEGNAIKMKQFVLSKMKQTKVPEELQRVIENSELSSILSSQLRFRWPFELYLGNINKGNVCVAGDAFHPMTPDLGQGGCAALEDGVTLARCLGEALLGGHNSEEGGKEECERIKNSLEKYAKERRWRCFDLIARAYILGYIQESDGGVMKFLRDKCFSGIMANMLLEKADFDCGKL